MCIIAYVPAGEQIPASTIKTMFRNNPDGAGIMWKDTERGVISIEKGFMTSNELLAAWKRIPKNAERAIHCRIATSGKISAACCHPFPVSKDIKDCFVTQTILNNDEFPITYKLTSGSFIESDLGENFVKGLSIAGIVLLAIVIVLTIVKNKKDGFCASIIEIGYIAILLLIIRAASVSLTLSGILTIAIMAIVNYFLLLTFMKTEKAIDKLEKFGNFILTIIPFIITIVVFALGKEVNTQSIGSVGIWGIFGFIYTLVAAIFLIDGKKAKKNGVE